MYSEFKIGMYVRCPIFKEHCTEIEIDNPRDFIIGQIKSINKYSNTINVEFYDFDNLKQYFNNIPDINEYYFNQVQRVKVTDGSIVRVEGKNVGKVICISENNTANNGYSKYYIKVNSNDKIIEVDESNIQAQFDNGDVDPITQIKNYELQNPMWYFNRQVVSKSINVLKNSTFGLETLVGSRVFLMPHQVETVIRVLSNKRCRFMLADEVGLGKTIEACVIMKGLKEKLGNLKTLIITPDALTYQWKNELHIKFWMQFEIGLDGILLGKENVIISMESLSDNIYKSIIESKEWDLIIVDETHKLIGMNEEYEFIKNVSKKSEHILLLSATPIQQNEEEYYKLLYLLDPEKYENMKKYEFKELMSKQSYIRKTVAKLVRDIDDYIEEELYDDYYDEFIEIAERLEDKKLKYMAEEIDEDSHDMGLSKVKDILSYIGENYQIEKKIIRHRRAELSDKVAKRSLDTISYYQQGRENGYYEADVYEKITTYIEQMLSESNSYLINEYIRLFLSAMFSSPWALKRIVNTRIDIIKNNIEYKGNEINLLETNYRQKENRDFNILSSVKYNEYEEEILDSILELINQWEYSVENEISEGLSKGKIGKIIEYLEENYQKGKFVIFTSWTYTLENLYEHIKYIFGDNSVTKFYSKMNEEELQDAADLFQNSEECRFIICDELGGEGRNFQNAYGLIHVDIPWSPSQLEQRIGRLDRIGRDINQNVVSVIVYAKETIEEDLFNLWNKGLNIFNESLSGLEIALDGIYKMVLNSLKEDINYGLKTSLQEISEYAKKMNILVKEEIYYDMSRQLNRKVESQLNKIIKIYDENNGEKLFESMMAWSKMAGLRPHIKDECNKIVMFDEDSFSYGSMINSLLNPPNLDEARKRIKNKHQIVGTFSRKLSVEREDLIFYSPSEPFFESIINNAYKSYKGTCSGFVVQSNLRWKGFVVTYRLSIDKRHLIKLGEDIENIAYGQGYMPLEPITVYVPLSEFNDVDIEDVKLELEDIYNRPKSVLHLGQREAKSDKLIGINQKTGLSPFEFIKSRYPKDSWSEVVDKVNNYGLNKVKREIEKIDFDYIKDEFKEKLSGIKYSSKYLSSENSNEEYERARSIYSAIYNGIKNPNIEVDSIAFVWMVK